MIDTYNHNEKLKPDGSELCMQLQFALLADSAQILPDGKFVISGGGIEVITAPTFPAMNPSLALVVRLTYTQEEAGHEHRFLIELLTPDGAHILPTQGTTTFIPSSPAERELDTPLSYMFVVNVPGLVFPTPGKYVFRIVIDGNKADEIPLFLRTPTLLREVDSTSGSSEA